MSDPVSEYETGVYVKGENVRIAGSPAEAVALTFDGFTRQGAEPGEDGPTYASLREQAKSLGIPATGTKDELAKAVADAQSNQS